MRGAPLKAIQELLGHSTIEMTMRYAHLSPTVKRDAVAQLDQPAPGNLGTAGTAPEMFAAPGNLGTTRGSQRRDFGHLMGTTQGLGVRQVGK